MHWRWPSSQTHLISYPQLPLHTLCTHGTGRPRSWCPSSCDRSAKPNGVDLGKCTTRIQKTETGGCLSKKFIPAYLYGSPGRNQYIKAVKVGGPCTCFINPWMSDVSMMYVETCRPTEPLEVWRWSCISVDAVWFSGWSLLGLVVNLSSVLNTEVFSAGELGIYILAAVT